MTLIGNSKLLIVNCLLLTIISYQLAISPAFAQESSSPSASQIPSDPTPKYPSTEEQAVYNLNNASLPTDSIAQPQTTDQNLFSKFASLFDKFKALLSILAFKPNNPPALHSGSQVLEQTSLPGELTPTSSGDPINDLKTDLGSGTSKYGINLPDSLTPSSTDKPVQSYENFYQQSNFPDGVTPITGQTP